MAAGCHEEGSNKLKLTSLLCFDCPDLLLVRPGSSVVTVCSSLVSGVVGNVVEIAASTLPRFWFECSVSIVFWHWVCSTDPVPDDDVSAVFAGVLPSKLMILLWFFFISGFIFWGRVAGDFFRFWSPGPLVFWSPSPLFFFVFLFLSCSLFYYLFFFFFLLFFSFVSSAIVVLFLCCSFFHVFHYLLYFLFLWFSMFCFLLVSFSFVFLFSLNVFLPFIIVIIIIIYLVYSFLVLMFLFWRVQSSYFLSLMFFFVSRSCFTVRILSRIPDIIKHEYNNAKQPKQKDVGQWHGGPFCNLHSFKFSEGDKFQPFGVVISVPWCCHGSYSLWLPLDPAATSNA